MHQVPELFGALMDALLGPSVTTIYDGATKNASLKLSPTVNDPALDIGIESQQVIYKTVFDRWWVPSIRRTVYEVVGQAPEEYRDRFDPRLFEKVTYPLLCLKMLKWTEYPHVYAIRAYIERVPSPAHKPYQVNL